MGVGRTSVNGNMVMPSTSVSSGSVLPVSSSLDAVIPVASSSLVSGIFGGSCVANLQWQKATGLVEDGWTVVKGKKMKPSTASFDMALRSHKKGSKGKAWLFLVYYSFFAPWILACRSLLCIMVGDFSPFILWVLGA